MRITPIHNHIRKNSCLKSRRDNSLPLFQNKNFQSRNVAQVQRVGMPIAALCAVFMNRLTANDDEKVLEYGFINEGIIKSKRQDSPELHQQKLDILEKVVSNESLKTSKSAHEAMFLLLINKNSPQLEYTRNMVDLISSDEKLYNNKSILSKFSDIAYINLWDFDDRKALLEKYIETPELSEVESIKNSIGKITANTNSWYQEKLAMKIFETPELYENSSIITNLVDSFLGVTPFIEQEDFEAKITLLDAFTGSEDLQQNSVIARNIGEIISNTDKSNLFMVKLATQNGLMETENFTKKLPEILTYAEDSNKSKILQLMLGKKALWEQDFPMRNMLESIYNEHQADVVRIILQHEEFQTKEMVESIGAINLGIRNLESKNMALDLLSNKNVLKEEKILKGFPILISISQKNATLKEAVYNCLIDNDIEGLKKLVITHKTHF